MLSATGQQPDSFFENLRAREFGRLDETGIAYLDYAASALYGATQVAAYADRLNRGVFGNPHSGHAPSQSSEAELEAARTMALAYFDADPDRYEICFTANTSAAIKLVAESYRFDRRRGLVLSADNHNSMNGLREYARAARAPVAVLPLDEELRLDDPLARLKVAAKRDGAGLLGLPTQSNFSGVRHSLDLVMEAEALGFDVMLDAAGAGVSGRISLAQHPCVFLVFSFYKIFGLPTGVGALIVRRDALARLQRPWFSGGTVDFVSVEHDRYQLRQGYGAFEDGTPNFLDLGAIAPGFDFLRSVNIAGLSRRLDNLTARFVDGARALKRADGAPLVRIYGPRERTGCGPTVAFNILRGDGAALPYQQVEERAKRMGVAIRGGCFCNPGAAERAFGFAQYDIPECLDVLQGDFSPALLRERLGGDATVGALRLSVGLPTSSRDIERALDLLASFAA